MSGDAPTSHQRAAPRSPEPVEEPHEQTLASWLQRFARWLLRFVLRLCLLFALYALSIGPLYWQWYGARFAGGSPLLAVIYEPLVRLGEWIAPFGKWMDWYVNLWIA